MGDTLEAFQKRWKPIATATVTPLERGHGRGKQPADRTDHALRGVPVIGHGSGAISGTAPGGEIGAGRRLEQAGRELVAARMKAARAKLSAPR